MPERGGVAIEIAVGTVLKYAWRVIEIRRGGMGIVYICERVPGGGLVMDANTNAGRDGDKGHARPLFAIKTMVNDKYFEGTNSESLRREALIWAALPPHPHLVTCSTVDVLDIAPMILLEYMPGGNLRDRLARGRLSAKAALRILVDVCDGMAFLAECGVDLHLDLKPENILFGDDHRARVTDFGLSSISSTAVGLVQAATDTGLTGLPTGVVGTLPYMSPEHFGRGQLSPASDVYSFGIVAFEMLIGRRPFAAASVPEYADAHVKAAPPDLGRRVHPAVAAVVAKCLAKDPADRYANFEQVRGALLSAAQSARVRVLDTVRTSREELEAAMSAGDWSGRGYAMARIGDLEASLRCYERALDLEPTWLGSNSNVGTALNRLGRRTDAFPFFEREVAQHPRAPMSHRALGVAYLNVRRYDDAAACLEKALSLDPTDMSFMRALINLYSGLGNTARTDALCDMLLANLEKEDDPDGWLNQAILLGQLHHYGLSMRVFQGFINRHPDNPDAWYNCAITLLVAQQVELAWPAAFKALELRSDRPQEHLLIGLIAALGDQTEVARAAFQQAYALGPNHVHGQIAQAVGHLFNNGTTGELLLQRLDEHAPLPDSLYFR